MGFNRIDAKLRAKASMRGTYPHPMLVTLVFILCTTGLTWLIGFFVTNPVTSMLGYLNQGYKAEEVMRYVFAGGRMTLFMFLSILLSLYTNIMSFGFTSYSLRMARNEQPTYKNLLDGFAMTGRVLMATLLIAVFAFLWEMLFLIPYMVALSAAIIAGSPGLMFIAVGLLLVGMILGFAKVYQYRLTFYFMLDNPGTMTAREAITQSKHAMKGNRWELFVMDLSYLGWMLLTPFTLGILGLWLTPYMGAAEANFYDAVTTGNVRLVNPVSPVEDSDSSHNIPF